MKVNGSISSTRQIQLLNAVFAIIVFALYFQTLAPSVSGGDSGDLLTAICTLGVPHPPGYPLYVLLGKIFLSLTIFGVSPAWAVNLSSAIYGTLAALLIQMSVTRLTRNQWSGWVAGGMFAFAPVIWRYAITSEVFALNNFLASAILYLFILYLKRGSFRLALVITAVFGLGLSNHHTLLFVGLPVVGFLFWEQRNKKGSFWKFLCSFLSGLLPYLYLPWAGARNLVTSWGQTDTLSGFLSHIFRSEYGTFRLAAHQFDPSVKGDLAKILYDGIFNELMGVGLGLAILGAWTLFFDKASEFKSNRTVRGVSSLGVVLGAVFGGGYFVVFFILNQMPADISLKFGVHLRFVQLILVPAYILVGLGFSKFTGFFQSQSQSQSQFQATTPFLRFFQPILSIILVTLQVGLHYDIENQNENYSSYRYAKAHLETLPANATLLLSGDGAYYPIDYLQTCERYRLDVSVIPRGLMGRWMVRHVREQFRHLVVPENSEYDYDKMNRSGDGFELRDFLDANYGKFPLYIANYNELENNNWEQFYVTWPTGFTNVIIKRGDPAFNRIQLLQTSSEILGTFDFSNLGSFPAETWENNYFRTYKENYSRLAMNLALASEEEKSNARFYLDLADSYFRGYFKDNPYPAPQALQQWTLIDQKRQRIP